MNTNTKAAQIAAAQSTSKLASFIKSMSNKDLSDVAAKLLAAAIEEMGERNAMALDKAAKQVRGN